jgi:hypothetical protein
VVVIRRRTVPRRFLRADPSLGVEAYPVEPYSPTMPAAFAWTGTVSAFRKAGFTEVLRRSRTRPIMRTEATKKKCKM